MPSRFLPLYAIPISNGRLQLGSRDLRAEEIMIDQLIIAANMLTEYCLGVVISCTCSIPTIQPNPRPIGNFRSTHLKHKCTMRKLLVPLIIAQLSSLWSLLVVKASISSDMMLLILMSASVLLGCRFNYDV